MTAGNGRQKNGAGVAQPHTVGGLQMEGHVGEIDATAAQNSAGAHFCGRLIQQNMYVSTAAR